jgi:hypothetical protein
MSETRAALTPEERLTAAYQHIVLGHQQQHVAMAMAVNLGRVNEAIQAVRVAIRDPKGTVKRARAAEDAALGVEDRNV